MKKIVVLISIICTIIIATLDSNARTASTADYRIEHADGTITLIWYNGGTTRARWLDVSGGPNNYPLGSYQCITVGFECWQFDWKREIWGIVLTDPNDPVNSKMEIMEHLSENYNDVLDTTYGYNNSYEQSDGEMPEFPIEDCQRFIFYGNGIVGYALEW